MRRTSRKAFTLIELMIVVAIIGILAAVAVPKFAEMVTRSKEAKVKGNIGAVRSAVSIYYGDIEGLYPENLFVGLTANARYMPSIGGVDTLGDFEIPKNDNNVGHSAVGTHKSATQAAILQADLSFVAPDDTSAIFYANTGSHRGEIFVNCTHLDSKGSVWTSY